MEGLELNGFLDMLKHICSLSTAEQLQKIQEIVAQYDGVDSGEHTQHDWDDPEGAESLYENDDHAEIIRLYRETDVTIQEISDQFGLTNPPAFYNIIHHYREKGFDIPYRQPKSPRAKNRLNIALTFKSFQRLVERTNYEKAKEEFGFTDDEVKELCDQYNDDVPGKLFFDVQEGIDTLDINSAKAEVIAREAERLRGRTAKGITFLCKKFDITQEAFWRLLLIARAEHPGIRRQPLFAYTEEEKDARARVFAELAELGFSKSELTELSGYTYTTVSYVLDRAQKEAVNG